MKHLHGKDNIVRAVKLHVISRGRQFEIERPLQLICPLELDAPVLQYDSFQEKTEMGKTRLNERPKRLTILVGETNKKLQIDFLNQED